MVQRRNMAMKEEAPPWKMAVPMDTREYLKGVQLNEIFIQVSKSCARETNV